ncbi:MAG: MFS transporter [Acidimicrobiales bacterium]|jgi:DHA1 family multidrug resistance protein-like MFS transporter
MSLIRPTSPQAGAARGPHRVVVALSISTFVEWAGAGSMMPLLPLYLRKLGAPVGLVGVVMAAFFLFAILVQYPIGRLSDRIGRRPVQLSGLVTFAVASAAFALIGTPIAALFVRGLQGAGAGVVDVANNATVGEVVSPSQQGRAYGALFGSRTVGLAIGPLVGGAVGLAGMRWLFVAAALASLLACVPVLVAVPKTAPRRAHVPAAKVVLWRDRSVLGVVMGYAGAGLVIGVYDVCWSLLLHLRGASGLQIGLSWTLFALPFAALSVPAGWLVDHFDRRYLAAASTLASAGFASTYPFLHSVWLLVGLGAAEAVCVSLAGPALAAQLAHSVPSRQLGRAQGVGSTAQTGATAVAALVAGALFGLHPWVPFVGASGAIVILVGLLSWFWRGVPGRDRRPGDARPGQAGRAPASPARPAPGEPASPASQLAAG